jgi:hypothetical protein
MFVGLLLGDVPGRSLTVRALRKITGLDLTHIPDRQEIPRGPGVYVRAPGVDCGVWYIGSGSGWNGLWSRLGTWFRGIEEMREQNIGPDPLVENGTAWWTPAVRVAYLRQLNCYGSALPEDSGPGPKVWEARMQQANRIAADNVSVLGGGAWENKALSPGKRTNGRGPGSGRCSERRGLRHRLLARFRPSYSLWDAFGPASGAPRKS